MAKGIFVSQLPKNILSELNDYLNAASEIYGVISQAQLAEIINSQNDYSVEIDDLKHVSRQNGYDHMFYMLHNKDVVHESLMMYDGDYQQIAAYQGNKPYKMFEKAELLKRAKNDFFELPQEYTKLRKYIVAELEVMRGRAEDICSEIYSYIEGSLPNSVKVV